MTASSLYSDVKEPSLASALSMNFLEMLSSRPPPALAVSEYNSCSRYRSVGSVVPSKESRSSLKISPVSAEPVTAHIKRRGYSCHIPQNAIGNFESPAVISKVMEEI